MNGCGNLTRAKLAFPAFVRDASHSAEEDLIERARDLARARHTTLNSALRERLPHFASSDGDAASFDAGMQQMSHINSAGPTPATK